MCVSKISHPSCMYLRMRASKKLKPSVDLCLRDEVFFISVPCTPAEYDRLKLVIEQLGGKAEAFFCKDVTTLLVDDRHVESNNSFCTKKISAEKIANIQGKSTNLKKIPASSSRGYSLLSQASAISGRLPNDSCSQRLIEKAKRWRIAITGIKKFLRWTESVLSSIAHPYKKKQSHGKVHVTKIIGYFIKVEDVSQVYKPFYKMLPNDSKIFMRFPPVRFLLGKRDHADLKPIVMADKASNSPIPVWKNICDLRQENVLNKTQPTFASLKVQGKNSEGICEILVGHQTRAKAKKKNVNYCECCGVSFINLSEHINGKKHQDFVSEEKNFDCVASLISQLPTSQDFLKKYEQKDCDQLIFKPCSTSGCSFSEISNLNDFGRGINCKIDNSVCLDDVISPIKTVDLLNFKDSNEASIGFELQEHDLLVNTNDYFNEDSFNKYFPDVLQYRSNIPSIADLHVKSFEDRWGDVCDENGSIHFLLGNNIILKSDTCGRSDIRDNKNPLPACKGSEIRLEGTAVVSQELEMEKQTDKSSAVNIIKENMCEVKENQLNVICKAGTHTCTIAKQSSPRLDNYLSIPPNSNVRVISLQTEDCKIGCQTLDCPNDHIFHVSGFCFEKSNSDCLFIPARADRMFSSDNSGDGISDKCLIDNALDIINDSSSIRERSDVAKKCSSENSASGGQKSPVSSLLSSSEDFPVGIPKHKGKSIWSVEKVASNCLRLRFTRIHPSVKTKCIAFSNL